MLTVGSKQDVRLMAHLLRRAGFGATPDELDRAMARGYDATVNDLLNPDHPDIIPDDLIRRYHTDQSDLRAAPSAGAHWVYRMVMTDTPLREKMCLFWHGIMCTGFAKVDHHRVLRKGFPEVILGEGKTPEQIADIAQAIKNDGSSLLITRIDASAYETLKARVPDTVYNATARIAYLQQNPVALKPGVTVACAGTSDIPVAEEAAITAELVGIITFTCRSSFSPRYFSNSSFSASMCWGFLFAFRAITSCFRLKPPDVPLASPSPPSPSQEANSKAPAARQAVVTRRERRWILGFMFQGCY